jgi:hypothetical protein
MARIVRILRLPMKTLRNVSGSVRRALASVAALSGLMGCASSPSGPSGTHQEPGGDSPNSSSCVSTREYFAQEVWPKVMAKKCITCHAPGGLAAERYSSLLLFPASYPGFLDQNLASLTDLAKTEYDDVSVLLQKPLGKLKHGGGAQIEEGSAEYTLLSSLVDRLRDATSCATEDAPAAPQGVILADAAATYRRASLLLAGRLPTAAETDRLAADSDGALPSLLDGLMAEPGFKDWLLVTFNDLFLTDRYLGDSTNTLRKEDFPNIDVYLADTVSDEEKRKFRRAVAREPLELIYYIVKNDRPFKEILTADYTLLNPYSAQIYNETTIPFPNPQDENDFRPGKISALRDGVMLPFPHAGLLSSPMFLNRFPTTPTNRNRARARVILQKFLATDILKVGDRPLDPTQAVAFANPTREDPSCSVCHSVIDPIAGAFMKFSDNDQEQLTPTREWYKEMVLPGFGDESMQVTDYPRALQWTAERVAADPRFPLSVTYNAYHALTGQQPLTYPDDGNPSELAAWELQDATLRAIAGKFADGGYNFKSVIREILLSPYFRATNVSADALTAEQGKLEAYGTARLSTPESLVRKLRATVGFDWVRYDKQPALTTTYDILYGGIDSDAVTQRLEEPNGVMSAVMLRMANEVSCQATAWDFLQPLDRRLLFPKVDVTDTPATAPDKIRANIRYLHEHILGETLADGSAELERTYGLFNDTWLEGTAKIAAKTLTNNPPWSCRGRWDRLTGLELPEGQRLEDDKNYVIRSWMAVITYLLADYRFLYE